MLSTQLKKIKDHLLGLQTLDRRQKQLLHELNFLDSSDLVEMAYEDYRYEELKLESFAVATGICPNCGKKY
jgi:hypothetical protein